MEIGSIIDILRSLPETAALKPGDVLTVKVLEVFEDRRALVDLGRFRALADITFPVAAGDEIRVRVQETQGQLRLQVVPVAGDPALSAGRAAGPVQAVAVESLKQLQVRIDQLAGALQRLPDSQPLPSEFRQVVDALRLFLEPFEPGSSPDALARKLKEFCEDSGLFLEHRLAAAVRSSADRAGGAPRARRPDQPVRRDESWLPTSRPGWFFSRFFSTARPAGSWHTTAVRSAGWRRRRPNCSRTSAPDRSRWPNRPLPRTPFRWCTLPCHCRTTAAGPG